MTGKELRAFRKSLNLNQADFAKLVGLNRYLTIGEYENAKLPIPDWLAKMVELLKNSI